MLIGLSVSALDEARAAQADPAVDYLGVGAMFPTGTKPDAEYGGPRLLQAVRAEVDLPLPPVPASPSSPRKFTPRSRR